jgi:hypothetical protein
MRVAFQLEILIFGYTLQGRKEENVVKRNLKYGPAYVIFYCIKIPIWKNEMQKLFLHLTVLFY